MDYKLIKWGNSLTLLAYVAGLCTILFTRERKCYFFGIVPLILRILGLVITVILVWMYVDAADVIDSDKDQLTYLSGYFSVLHQDDVLVFSLV